MPTFRAYLESISACNDALAWLGDRDFATAWRECDRGDWMLWLAARLGVRRKSLVRCTCACVRPSLQYVPAGEDRPRIAIEMAEAWAHGKGVKIKQVRAAYAAAYASADAADATAAANAAYAAYAAAYAAAAAATAANAATSLSASDDICRAMLTAEVTAAWESINKES